MRERAGGASPLHDLACRVLGWLFVALTFSSALGRHAQDWRRNMTPWQVVNGGTTPQIRRLQGVLLLAI